MDSNTDNINMDNLGQTIDNTSPKVIVLPRNETTVQPVPGTMYLALADGRLVPVRSISRSGTSPALPLKSENSTNADSDADQTNLPLKITKSMSLAPAINNKRGGEDTSGSPTKKVKLNASADDSLDDDCSNAAQAESEPGDLSEIEENEYTTPEYLYDELDDEANDEDTHDDQQQDGGVQHSPDYEPVSDEGEEADPEFDDDYEDDTYSPVPKYYVRKTPVALKSFSKTSTTSSRVNISKLLKSKPATKVDFNQTPRKNPSTTPQVSSIKRPTGILQKNVAPKMDKSELVVPSNFNQYGECLKTRFGRYRYGFTLTDPPSQFFQGVLKSGTGKMLAVMFADTDLLAKLERLPHDDIGDFIIDNTFRAIPDSTKDIKYLLTVNIIFQNQTHPLWIALTSCSSCELYKRILLEFQQYVLDWPFKTILINDDPVLCKAVQTVFPDAQLYGSWFYYCYSIWKEVSLNKLVDRCKTDPVIMTGVRMLMVIPYLPPLTDTFSSSVSMLQGFQVVKDYARENDLPPEFDKVLNYVATFWFTKVKTKNFTVYGKHTNMLSNVETIQLAFLSFMKTGGNIWTLTHSFQSVTKAAHSEFVRYMNGKPFQGKRNRGRRFNASVRKNMKKLMAGSMSVKTYLEQSVAFCEDVLDIFLHPAYPTTADDPSNNTHVEGWKIRIRDT